MNYYLSRNFDKSVDKIVTIGRLVQINNKNEKEKGEEQKPNLVTIEEISGSTRNIGQFRCELNLNMQNLKL